MQGLDQGGSLKNPGRLWGPGLLQKPPHSWGSKGTSERVLRSCA